MQTDKRNIMSTGKMSWGVKIAMLYSGFVVLMVTLVTLSMKQDFHLVSDDYYQEEIEYQQVLDAGKNQAALSKPVSVSANGDHINIAFPDEFKEQLINGTVQFYSPVNSNWDKTVTMTNVETSYSVSKDELISTRYKVKLSWEAAGKKYYQETDINLF